MADSRKVTVPSRYHTVADVVGDRLCHSCGVCGGVCPQGAVEFDDHARPVVGSQCNGCGLCLQACSGWQGCGVRREKDDEAAAYLAASTDRHLRLKSSSGGLVTELLRFLLKSGRISAALVTVSDPDNPARLVSILAETEEQLLASCQSRYALFPWGTTLGQLHAFKKPYAVVGTSCQLSSFHNVLRLFPKLGEHLVVTIGICCESNIEPQATDHLLRARKTAADDVMRIEYRSGSWPGVMSAFLRDGSETVLSSRNRLEGAINYLKLCYGRERCRFCSDVLCQAADLTVGDPWGRDGRGRLVYRDSDGYSSVLVRSRSAAGWLREIAQEGLVLLEEKDVAEVFGLQLRQVAAGRARAKRLGVSAGAEGRNCPADISGGSGGLTATDRCRMFLEDAAHREPLRTLLMSFFFSPAGDLFTLANSRLKRWRSRRG